MVGLDRVILMLETFDGILDEPFDVDETLLQSRLAFMAPAPFELAAPSPEVEPQPEKMHIASITMTTPNDLINRLDISPPVYQ